MPAKIKNQSRIFKAVHETTSDLHKLGFIDQRKMSKFDALCLTPIQERQPRKKSKN